MSSVKVAVRVRPFNNREITRAASCIIDMNGPQTGKIYLCNNAMNECTLSFIFPLQLLQILKLLSAQKTRQKPLISTFPIGHMM